MKIFDGIFIIKFKFYFSANYKNILWEKMIVFNITFLSCERKRGELMIKSSTFVQSGTGFTNFSWKLRKLLERKNTKILPIRTYQVGNTRTHFVIKSSFVDEVKMMKKTVNWRNFFFCIICLRKFSPLGLFVRVVAKGIKALLNWQILNVEVL